MKIVNKNFVVKDFVHKCNASQQCTCHTLCSRLFIYSSLQRNCIISYHSEPVVALADRLFPSQSFGQI